MKIKDSESNGFISSYNLGGGGGGSELTDGWGCAILALEVIPKKILPKNLFYKILHLLFQQGKLCLTNISSKNG